PAHPPCLSVSHFLVYPATSTPAISTLSLHDALPISTDQPTAARLTGATTTGVGTNATGTIAQTATTGASDDRTVAATNVETEARSEEHTSELQSRENLVCRLLLEKKKQNQIKHHLSK